MGQKPKKEGNKTDLKIDDYGFGNRHEIEKTFEEADRIPAKGAKKPSLDYYDRAAGINKIPSPEKETGKGNKIKDNKK